MTSSGYGAGLLSPYCYVALTSSNKIDIVTNINFSSYYGYAILEYVKI